MPTNVISDNIYASVKAFGQKGRLLSYQTLESLAESRDLDDLITKLRGTPYTQSVTELQPPHSADKLEKAFTEHLARMHFSLLKVSPQSELLLATYLRHIASNLKTILKGKALNRSYEEITRHIHLHAEELIGRRDIVVKALTAQNLDEAARALAGSEFGEQAAAATRSYKEKAELQLFDIYIDRAFYSSLVGAYGASRSALSSEQERIRPLLAVEIDSYNALSALRAKLWDLPKPEARALMVESDFAVPSDLLEDLVAAESVDEALKVLTRTEYRSILPKEVSGREALSKLEEAFALLSHDRAQRAFLWNEFGVSLALAIVKLMEFEVRNLSAIALGVEQRVGVQRMVEKLVYSKGRRT